jgi:hypothetical protein
LAGLPAANVGKTIAPSLFLISTQDKAVALSLFIAPGQQERVARLAAEATAAPAANAEFNNTPKNWGGLSPMQSTAVATSLASRSPMLVRLLLAGVVGALPLARLGDVAGLLAGLVCAWRQQVRVAMICDVWLWVVGLPVGHVMAALSDTL